MKETTLAKRHIPYASWPETCKVEHRRQSKAYVAKHPEVKRFYKMKYRARDKGVEFTLTIEMVADAMSNPCFYCGTVNRCGFDRVDNGQGYTPDNCVIACWPCNRLKGTLSQAVFLDICRKVAGHHNKPT